ncbi:MAG: nitroreductase family deazaflavin-dependent oxidoreductase [Gammaproteobacteria bacterium TMED92]|nr:MAG: nitroreductase family deazaflavin-dependent oxidoreductase [Gammaproteobacteria bacterium TMED92]
MGSTLPDWAQEHMRNYLATDGADGHIWRGVPTLLLTTIGNRTGVERMLPLIYGEESGDYIIIASKGGFPEHPAWYNNLVAQPQVKVQVAADKFTATATTVANERRQTLWDIMAEVWPPYIEYQEKTNRLIPVVVLTRN